MDDEREHQVGRMGLKAKLVERVVCSPGGVHGDDGLEVNHGVKGLRVIITSIASPAGEDLPIWPGHQIPGQLGQYLA